MPETALAGILICVYDLVDIAAARADLPFLFNAERLFPCLVFHIFLSPPFYENGLPETDYEYKSLYGHRDHPQKKQTGHPPDT